MRSMCSHSSRFAVVVLLFSAVFLAACSGGGGGSDAGASTPSDTTSPITTVDPMGGDYDATQLVDLTSNEAATIYYSTDGNDPSVGGANTISGTSPIVGIPIPEGSTKLKFFAIDQSGNSESIRTETYVVNISNPNVSLIGGAPAPVGLLDAATVNWQSDEDGTYIIEIGGNGTIGSGTQILSGSVQAGMPVASQVQGIQLSYAGPTTVWVYVTDSFGGIGTLFAELNLKPLVTIPTTTRVEHIEILSNGLKAYVTSANQVLALDTDPSSGTYNTIIGAIPVGTRPWDIASTPDNARAYVTNEQSLSISEISTTTDTVLNTIPAGSRAPNGIAITPDGTRGYFLNFDGRISVLDTDTSSASYNLVLGNISRPLLLAGDIAITPDGNKAVVNWQGTIAHAVDVFDVNPSSPTYNQLLASPIPVISGLGGDVAISSDSTFAYVTSSYVPECGLCKIDLQTYTIQANNSTVLNGYSLALTPDDQILLTGGLNRTGIAVFSAADVTFLGSIDIGTSINALKITPDGTRGYVVEFDSSAGSLDIIMLPLQ